MSHRKKCPKGKLQMQKFTKKLSENHFEPLGRFYGTFKKSSEFNSNIKMPRVSLSDPFSVEALENYTINDVPSIFKFDNSLPMVYMENIPQNPSNFIHLPMEYIIEKCKLVKGSDSLFLIKTSRDAYEDRFRLR